MIVLWLLWIEILERLENDTSALIATQDLAISSVGEVLGVPTGISQGKFYGKIGPPSPALAHLSSPSIRGNHPRSCCEFTGQRARQA